MFTTFTNSAVINGAPGRTPSLLRLVHSNNNPSSHNPQEGLAATVAPPARERRVRRHVLACRWHVVPSTGRLECSWSEQASDGAALEPPKPSRRRGRTGHGSKTKTVRRASSRDGRRKRACKIGPTNGIIRGAAASGTCKGPLASCLTNVAKATL